MDYKLKILGVTSHDGLVTHANYQLTAIDGESEANSLLATNQQAWLTQLMQVI